MYPFLFRIGDFALHSYTFFLGISFLAALFFTQNLVRKFPEVKLDVEQVLFHGLLSFIVGLISARLVFWAVEFEKWIADPLIFFRPWEGGIVFWGGLLGGVTYWVLFFRFKRIPIREGLSVLSIGIVFAHAIGRIGCFLNGCCFGDLCHLDRLCVTYTHTFSNAPTGVPVYPTQVFESLFLFLLGMALWRLNKLHINIRYIGQVWLFEAYLLAYSLFRFFIEELRGDLRRGFWGPFSTSQWISIFVILALIVSRMALQKLAK
jgi:phosphatidylglycerol:prolipoprotein diacylglycerol transferase